MSSPGSSARRPMLPQPRSSTRASGARRASAKNSSWRRARARAARGEASRASGPRAVGRRRGCSRRVSIARARAAGPARTGATGPAGPSYSHCDVRARHDPHARPRGVGALLPHDAGRARDRARPRSVPTCWRGTTSRSCRRTPAHEPTRRLHWRSWRPRASRSTPSGRPGADGSRDAGPRGRARSTAPTTTERSCSIPTATAPRPSTTATPGAAATSTTCGSECATSGVGRFYTALSRYLGLRRGGAGSTARSSAARGRRSRSSPTDGRRHPACTGVCGADRQNVATFTTRRRPRASRQRYCGRAPAVRSRLLRGLRARPDGTNVESVARGSG